MSKVLYEKQGGVCYVTLNRPEVKNAIDLDMHRQLWDAWRDFAADPALRVAVLTGAGDAFCAGADLKTHVASWLGADASFPRRKLSDGLGGITRGLHRVGKPIIAAVNGWALAGGLELALACDLRVASERAKFGSFEVRRGMHHMDGGIARLVNICGAGVAMEMLLTGEPVDATRALNLGIVTRTVPHDELLAATDEVVATILRNDRTAVESAKEVILEMIGRPLEEQLTVEALLGSSLVANPELHAHLSDFSGKTPGP